MTQTKAFTFFFNSKKIKQKKWIDYEFILDESYEDYFMKYLVNINQNEDQKYDILTNKNSKFLFHHFNDYLAHINEPTKPEGRFPGSQQLKIIPKPDIPKFIKTEEIISTNQLCE